jgi:tagatose 6-phosphate kinase
VHILAVTPNPSLDEGFSVDELVPGTEITVQAAEETAGGKGVNLARGARILGMGARCLCSGGGWTGERHRALVQPLGIPLRMVPTGGETRRFITILAQGEVTRLRVGSGSVHRPEFGRDFATALDEELALRPAAVACAGSLPPGAPPDLAATVMASGRAAGAFTALDASGEALRRGLEGRPDLVKVNVAEAAGLGLPLADGPAAAVDVAHQLAARYGVPHVWLTLGAGGSAGVGPTGTWQVAPLAVAAGSPIGCGDAFLAGWLVAWLASGSVGEAARLAAAAAAANAEGIAPARFTRPRVDELARKVAIVR